MADKKTTAVQTTDVLATKRAELVEAKRSHAAGELINPRTLRSLRKDIARELTARNAKPANDDQTEVQKEGDA